MKCILCGLRPSRRDYWTPDILRCPRCTLVYADPVCLDRPAEEIYGASYFRDGEYYRYDQEPEIARRNFRPLIRQLAARQPAGRLFEIGCAFGFFLDLARSRWSVAGIDVSREGIRHAREVLGLDARCGDFLAEPIPPEPCDIVCLWDTIEHLQHPDRMIDRAARWLRPGGWLALTTGDIGSLNARLRGRCWRLIHPPTHLFYFSRETLGALLAMHGFTVVHLSRRTVWRSLATMAHQLGLHRLRDSPLGSLAVPLNLLDILFVIARRDEPAAGRAPRRPPA